MGTRNAGQSRWKAFRRRYLRPARNAVIGHIGAPLVRFWIQTLRMRWHGDVYRVDGLPNGASRGIYVFWHQGLLTFAGYFRNSGTRIVISSHGDGELIARIVENLGMTPVRGSSTRGGTRAMLELLRTGDEEVNIAVTPDGPRGPKHHFHSGAVYLASRSGLPVYPVALSLANAYALRTWDNFLLPRPFTRALISVGDPVLVAPEADRETIEGHRLELEKRLQALTKTAKQDFERLYAASPRLVDLPGRPVSVP